MCTHSKGETLYIGYGTVRKLKLDKHIHYFLVIAESPSLLNSS